MTYLKFSITSLIVFLIISLMVSGETFRTVKKELFNGSEYNIEIDFTDFDQSFDGSLKVEFLLFAPDIVHIRFNISLDLYDTLESITEPFSKQEFINEIIVPPQTTWMIFFNTGGWPNKSIDELDFIRIGYHGSFSEETIDGPIGTTSDTNENLGVVYRKNSDKGILNLQILALPASLLIFSKIKRRIILASKM